GRCAWARSTPTRGSDRLTTSSPRTRPRGSRSRTTGCPDFPSACRLASIVLMCRNIRTLYNFEPPTTTDEVHAAAVQYVRKVSGMQRPSQANEAAFERAIAAVASATEQLLGELVTSAAPRDREVEAERRRARSAARFGHAA